MDRGRQGIPRQVATRERSLGPLPLGWIMVDTITLLSFAKVYAQLSWTFLSLVYACLTLPQCNETCVIWYSE